MITTNFDKIRIIRAHAENCLITQPENVDAKDKLFLISVINDLLRIAGKKDGKSEAEILQF